MTISKSRFASLVLTSFVLAAASAAAAGQDAVTVGANGKTTVAQAVAPAGHEMKVERRVVIREEHTFDSIDSNHDGMISRAEFDAAHAAMAAKMKDHEMKMDDGQMMDHSKMQGHEMMVMDHKDGAAQCGVGQSCDCGCCGSMKDKMKMPMGKMKMPMHK